MPDYLNFSPNLNDLDPHDAENRLEEQILLLQGALSRLNEADKVRAEIFECVVSV